MFWFEVQVMALKTASVPYILAFFAVFIGGLYGEALRRVLGIRGSYDVR